MNIIFTVSTGRSGQNTLSEYFNRYGKKCYAEVDPPHLIYKEHWLFGNFARIVQRKWIVTHEDLGRGEMLKWYDDDENSKLDKIVRKKIRRINKFKCKYYIEMNKNFIRSYCDAVYKLHTDIGIINLFRNPMETARSYVNRNKNIALDGVMPNFKKACFKINIKRLTKYQLYLWQWVETELRFQRFIKDNGITKYYALRTEDLNDNKKLEELFRFFGIEFRDEIKIVRPYNTNVSQGKLKTVVKPQDIREFKTFLSMIPNEIMNKLEILQQYYPTL